LTLRFLIAAAAALVSSLASAAPPTLTAQQRGADFDAMWSALERGYVYLDRAVARRARAEDRRRAVASADHDAFLRALERSLDRLRDDHVMLGERASASPRRVPAESDVWASWRDGRAIVEAIRPYGDADMAGLRPGHRILRIDGVAVEKAAPAADARGRDWALRHAIAGPRFGALRLEVEEGGATRTLTIERAATPTAAGPAVSARRIGEGRDLGYVRIRGALGDAAVARELPEALRAMNGVRGWIIDLRGASGDGAAAAVESILARFAPAAAPWRMREDAHGRRSVDSIAPASPAAARAPVVVLVDRWTAGDGEALAAGLAAVANARLVGTPMAAMRGETVEAALPHSGIRVRFPAERVLHVDGTPRERLRPAVEVDLAAPNGGPGDPILYQALKLFERK
jgi:C-terminal processing protease CtpA/Prc